MFSIHPLLKCDFEEMRDEKPAEADFTGPVWVVWTCPFCGGSRGKLAPGGISGDRAVSYLLRHVRQIDDQGHGPLHQPPESGKPESPESWIETVDYPG